MSRLKTSYTISQNGTLVVITYASTYGSTSYAGITTIVSSVLGSSQYVWLGTSKSDYTMLDWELETSLGAANLADFLTKVQTIINQAAGPHIETTARSTDFTHTAGSSTVVGSEIWETVLSLASFTTTLTTAKIDVRFNCAWRHTGTGGVNVAAIFRILLNGSTVGGSSTENGLTNQLEIGHVEKTFTGISAGSHTIEAQMAWFGGAGQTVGIPVATLPTLCHAELYAHEHI